MGVGRREFLRLTSIALTGLMVDPLQAVATNNNQYVNKKLGILFSKPNDWGFLQVKDFGKLKEGQILNGQWEDIKEEVLEDLGDPLCVITKYYQDLPEYEKIFSPTITVHVTHRSELDDVEFENMEEMMDLSRQFTSEVLKGFKVLKTYDPYISSGCKFYEYDAEYLFEHKEFPRPVAVELKVIKAENNDFYYDFNCHQSKEQGQLAGKEFMDFKRSIKLI